VAFASNLSALWILTANAWMQHPVGYTIRNGRAELTDFLAVATQSHAIHQFVHTISAAYVLAGFFVMGVSAYHLLRKQHVDFFNKSFRLALNMALIFSIVTVVHGHANGAKVASAQPAKLAAMESLWETQKGAAQYLLVIPDEKNQRNLVEWGGIPGALSMLAYHSMDATVKGLKDFPEADRPPVTVTFLSFRIMVGLGMLFLALTIYGWLRRNKLEESPLYLKIMMFSIPLPYIASEMGWTVAEVGRQPWVVYGVMRTSDAVSPIASSQVMVSLVAMVLVYTLLGAAAFYLIASHARKGPEPVKVRIDERRD